MNTFDIIAIICSLVALLCSAVAPVVAAFINSHTSKKIKKIELFYEKKFNALPTFPFILHVIRSQLCAI